MRPWKSTLLEVKTEEATCFGWLTRRRASWKGAVYSCVSVATIKARRESLWLSCLTNLRTTQIVIRGGRQRHQRRHDSRLPPLNGIYSNRRPLEAIKVEEGAPAAAALAAAAPVAPTSLTSEDRMEIIRNATEMLEILRSMLRRGAYFEGAIGVHDDVRVHRAAMRAAATLMRRVRYACVCGVLGAIVFDAATADGTCLSLFVDEAALSSPVKGRHSRRRGALIPRVHLVIEPARVA